MKSQGQEHLYRQLRLLAAEFAAPLQYINAAAELISFDATALPESIRHHIAGIHVSSQRLLQMTDLLLLHEGVMGGQQQLQLEPVNVAAVAHQAYVSRLRLHHLQPLHDYIDVTSHAWPAQSNRQALQAALEALCDLLIQTSDHPLQAAAKLVKRENNVELHITDDGPVITKKQFYQTGKTLQEQPLEGLRAHSVLAFAIARDLIDAMKGHLSMAATDLGLRHTVVRLPMTNQLNLLQV